MATLLLRSSDSQPQGAPGGLQPGQATGAAGRTRSSERPARTRLSRSSPVGHPALVVTPCSHLCRHRARPCCRHITYHMILSRPGAWSAEPSSLLSAPWNHCSMVPRVMPLVLGRARRSERGSTGGANHIQSSLSVVQMDAAPVSTAAQWPQVDHGSIRRGLLAHGPLWIWGH